LSYVQAIGQKGIMFNSFQAGGLEVDGKNEWRKSFAAKEKFAGSRDLIYSDPSSLVWDIFVM
jgi:hypothetical protein